MYQQKAQLLRPYPKNNDKRNQSNDSPGTTYTKPPGLGLDQNVTQSGKLRIF